MDVRELKYPDSKFDLIVDKSTIDAMLCGNNAYFNVAIMLVECQRVLKTGGYYVAVSYGQPPNREFHFQRDNLSFEL
jgi:ubiquinone/menaquinone biosynthesis C-methylase UbiE